MRYSVQKCTAAGTTAGTAAGPVAGTVAGVYCAVRGAGDFLNLSKEGFGERIGTGVLCSN